VAKDKLSVLLIQDYCELLKNTVSKNSFIVQQIYQTFKYKSFPCFLLSRWNPTDATLCQFMLLKLFFLFFAYKEQAR